MTNSNTGKIVHTVFFWLKEPENQAHQDALYKGLQALSEIDLIKQSFIGKPANTRRPVIDSSYNFSITFVFDNIADQDAYQIHPDHYVFIDSCSNLWARVQVYDSEN